MAKKIAVVLSGCGVYDGSEIHEAVLTLLALDRAGAEIVCAAPDVDQAHVVNHRTGDVASGEKRNVLIESARIARGKIVALRELHAADIDAAIFPGGFGAAKNLSTYAFKGAALTVEPEVERFVREVHAARKPLGFVCIAPVIAAKILGKEHPTLTIGSDAQTASDLESCGAKHRDARVEDVVVDDARRVVTTAAYMLAGRISEAAAGIDKLVQAVLRMA